MLRIKELREARGLSQEGLARVTGLSVKTIRRAEKTGRASGASLTALADGLDCDVSDLFERGQVPA